MNYLQRITILLIIFFTSTLSYSHGTVTSPPSRVWICYQENPENPISPACIASVNEYGTQHLYDWNGIRQGDANGNHQDFIENGNLASGGNPLIYGGLDQVRSDWVKTPVNSGPYTVTWTNSAPHATEYYEVYITNEDWTPEQELRWDNITLLVQTPFSLAASSVDIEVDLPPRSGHHVIFSIWQRADSPEAFYSVSDVDFGDDGGGEAESKKVIIDQDLEITRNLKVNAETYIPALANGQEQNLILDAEGKVSVSSNSPMLEMKADGLAGAEISLNRFDFNAFEIEGKLQTLRSGLHFKDGSEIDEIKILYINSSQSDQDQTEVPYFRIYRIEKLTLSPKVEMLVEVELNKDKKRTYLEVETLDKNALRIINNRKYIYYAELMQEKEGDFREVVFSFK